MNRNGWAHWLVHAAGITLTLVLCYAAFMLGESAGRQKEREWWQAKMIERGEMQYHEKSGKLHWKANH